MTTPSGRPANHAWSPFRGSPAWAFRITDHPISVHGGTATIWSESWIAPLRWLHIVSSRAVMHNFCAPSGAGHDEADDQPSVAIPVGS
jgi:hypothetical protein